MGGNRLRVDRLTEPLYRLLGCHEAKRVGGEMETKLQGAREQVAILRKHCIGGGTAIFIGAEEGSVR
ncbi:hypothetical protein Acr_00g0047680 [Actinidia rufa]|uniref:Uncharacterized protein n=1 Tax=Actinidia rufa TaxID=165716 RepID=A0A7J0DKF9_9ERIC|nr:hypothetical protein Acr_00g0047680 [Actinidia rufa]